MPAGALRVIARSYDGGVDLLLDGELDLTTVGDVDATVRRLSSQYDAGQVTIDVSRLTFLDVRGADSFRRIARLWGGGERVTIRGRAPHVDLLLDLVGVIDRFERVGTG